jgi:cysteine synthase B
MSQGPTAIPGDVRAGPLRAPSVLELIGQTPLMRLTRVTRRLVPDAVRVMAKLEGFNPGGSVKDRPARRMLEEGLRTGELRPGKTIIDSTSGNTGIALAMIGAALGYPVELVMPSNVSTERKKVIAAYGAKIIYSDPMEGSDGAIRMCREILAGGGERYFKPDQYFNAANPTAHYETTGPEIWEQTGGAITHFVAGIGTGGTIMGTGRYLKERRADIQVVAVEPDDALHGLEGLKHMESSIVPGIYDETKHDRKISVSTEASYDMVYRIAETEGLLVGQSSGAALVGALEIARELESGTVVLIFCDWGERYLSTNLWAAWPGRQRRNGHVQ